MRKAPYVLLPLLCAWAACANVPKPNDSPAALRFTPAAVWFRWLTARLVLPMLRMLMLVETSRLTFRIVVSLLTMKVDPVLRLGVPAPPAPPADTLQFAELFQLP